MKKGDELKVLETLECSKRVKQQTDSFVSELVHHLNENLKGVYLHGSLAMGSFNESSSDIDLLVVLYHSLTAMQKRELTKLMVEVSSNPCPLEISFLTEHQVKPWKHPCPFEWHYSEEWRTRYISKMNNDDWTQGNKEPQTDVDLAAHITVINHRGICLYGEPIHWNFPKVPKKDYLNSVFSDLDWSMEEVVEEKPVYAILNHCRTYAYLCTGKILSKEEGGIWALTKIPKHLRPVIKEALKSYCTSHPYEMGKSETMECLRIVRLRIKEALRDETPDCDLSE